MNKIDYENKRLNQIKQAKNNKLLLHSCCAPCSSGVIDRLVDFFDITIYFYNPNMDTEEEFIKRANEQVRYVNERYADKIKVIIPPYDNQRYLDAVKGYEDAPEGGSRCEKCFALRFTKCAKYASENGFDFITTTLTVSPYKNATLINTIGEKVCEKYDGVSWLYCDFKKNNGYLNSIKNSKEYNLYRQDYCGCIYSYNQMKNRKGTL